MPGPGSYKTSPSGPGAGRRASADDFAAGVGARVGAIQSENQARAQVDQADANANAKLAQGVNDLSVGVYERAERAKQREQAAALSVLHAKVAETHQQFTERFRQVYENADPNDREIGKRFIGEFDEFTKSLDGQVKSDAEKNYLIEAKANMRSSFETQAAKEQAELAGTAAVTNQKTSVKSYTNVLLQNPSQAQTVRQQYGALMDSMVTAHNLPTKTAHELIRADVGELAQAEVRGWIKKDRAYAKAGLAQGDWNSMLTADQSHGLSREIQEAENTERSEKDRQHAAAKQAEMEADLRRYGEVVEKIGKPGSEFSFPDLALTPLSGAHRASSLGLLQSKVERDKANWAAADKNNVADLWLKGEFHEAFDALPGARFGGDEKIVIANKIDAKVKAIGDVDEKGTYGKAYYGVFTGHTTKDTIDRLALPDGRPFPDKLKADLREQLQQEDDRKARLAAEHKDPQIQKDFGDLMHGVYTSGTTPEKIEAAKIPGDYKAKVYKEKQEQDDRRDRLKKSFREETNSVDYDGMVEGIWTNETTHESIDANQKLPGHLKAQAHEALQKNEDRAVAVAEKARKGVLSLSLSQGDAKGVIQGLQMDNVSPEDRLAFSDRLREMGRQAQTKYEAAEIGRASDDILTGKLAEESGLDSYDLTPGLKARARKELREEGVRRVEIRKQGVETMMISSMFLPDGNPSRISKISDIYKMQKAQGLTTEVTARVANVFNTLQEDKRRSNEDVLKITANRAKGESFKDIYAGEIRTEDQLRARVGAGGLSVPDFKDMREELATLTGGTEGARRHKLVDGFITRMVEGQLAPKRALGIPDPEGDPLVHEYLLSWQPRFDAAIADGKRAEDLVNPAHKDYLATDLAGVVASRTIQAKARSLIQRFNGQVSAPGAIAGQSAGVKFDAREVQRARDYIKANPDAPEAQKFKNQLDSQGETY